MNLVLLGAPGSGKGTQGEVLSQHYNLKKIALGDILREERSEGTSLGNKVKKYMEEGVLVPDDIIKEVMGNKIQDNGFLIDGFPRNINQAKMLEDILAEKKLELNAVIYLDVSEDTIVRRLTGRRICSKCGALYHVVNMPSKEEGKCDKCGAELIMRKDDKEDTVRKRWEVFMGNTHALIDYYSKKNLLMKADGNLDKDRVFNIIRENLSR